MKQSPTMTNDLVAFVTESNRIEGITRAPLSAEITIHDELLKLKTITVDDLKQFVDVIAGARIRTEKGMNVRVGNFHPPPGGPQIRAQLVELLKAIESSAEQPDRAGGISPYEAHRHYETLHPFTDGNGRSGRALWVWHMQRAGQDPFALPFLHRFYYQALEGSR